MATKVGIKFHSTYHLLFNCHEYLFMFTFNNLIFNKLTILVRIYNYFVNSLSFSGLKWKWTRHINQSSCSVGLMFFEVSGIGKNFLTCQRKNFSINSVIWPSGQILGSGLGRKFFKTSPTFIRPKPFISTPLSVQIIWDLSFLVQKLLRSLCWSMYFWHLTLFIMRKTFWYSSCPSENVLLPLW